MTGGEAIVRAVLNHGVDTVFGLPGAQTYPLFDALAKSRDAVRTIGTRHEQGAAYMALGYAKSTGRPGVYSVVPGPGVLNTGAALCTAFGSNTPVLCLTGQVPSQFLGRGRGHLHELPDQLATLASFIKWAGRIESPEEAGRVVGDAFRAMLSGRRGPASVEMCWDIMGHSAVMELPQPAEPDPPPKPDGGVVAEAAKALARAKHPMIMVGGGAQHAREAVLALAEALDAPVTAFRSGRGVVSDDHPLGLTSVAAYRLFPETDVLVGIGTRLELPYMRWANMHRLIAKAEAPPVLIRIDIDPEEMNRLEPHFGIVADAGEGAWALAEAVAKNGRTPTGARERIAEARRTARQKIEVLQPQLGYLDVIREVLPRDGFFVEELCQAGYTSYFGFPVYEPRTYVAAGYQGTLGFGFPTALGVKVANPGKAVVSIAGDGGFLFGMQELATAAQERIGLVAIVFNNSSLGNIRRDQLEAFEGRLIACDLTNPDFLKLAESFGVAGYRVETPGALKSALERALAEDAPALIEVVIEKDSEVSPWPFIHPGRSYMD